MKVIKSSQKNILKDLQITNTILNMLYMRKLITISSAIHFKNRFLLRKKNYKLQFIGLLLNNGNKLITLKTVNLVYLEFLRFFNNISLVKSHYDLMVGLNLDVNEFTRLYNMFGMFKDVSRVINWRLQENLPMIKNISIKLKKKKLKKKLKKEKYSTIFKYVKQPQRAQIALRWLTLLMKVNSTKLIYNLFKIFIPFLVDPKQSKLDMVKKKVYSGLLKTK